MNPNTPWTEDRVDLLKKLWESGISCSQIAVEMNCGFTRNAIIGKVHRLELEGRSNRNGFFYRPVPESDTPRRKHRRTVFTSRERKPRAKILNPNEKPALMAVVSNITGSFIATRRCKPAQQDLTKNELRAMLADAVRNTAAMVLS